MLPEISKWTSWIAGVSISGTMRPDPKELLESFDGREGLMDSRIRPVCGGLLGEAFEAQ